MYKLLILTLLGITSLLEGLPSPLQYEASIGNTVEELNDGMANRGYDDEDDDDDDDDDGEIISRSDVMQAHKKQFGHHQGYDTPPNIMGASFDPMGHHNPMHGGYIISLIG